MTQTNFQPGISSANFAPDLLVAGDHPIRTVSVTVLAGQNLVRGAVLGLITASQKVNLSLSTASDGSQVPFAILVDDVNATAGDRQGVAYIAGDFNSRELVLGASHTVASIRNALAARSIYIHTPVPSV